MELVRDIDNLLDAIDREISLLHQVTTRMNLDMDTRGTQDMARWLDKWEPFEVLDSPANEARASDGSGSGSSS